MRASIILFLMLFFISGLRAQVSGNKAYNLLIGTYTNKEKSNGIHVYHFDSESGEFSEKSKTLGITNPSFLAISKDKQHVYAVSEAGAGKGKISVYSFDPELGKLTYINSAPSGGNGPCYVSVDDEKKLVFAGNYGSGTLSAIKVNSDGSLQPDIQTIQHQGSSVDKKRQKSPHVHAVVVSPDNRYLFVPDLGIDKINVYAIETAGTESLKATGEVIVKSGSGPRHLTFHPNGKFAYVIHELDATVTAFDYEKGKLEAKQTITLLSPDFTGTVGAADIHISPDGKFLYGSNRGDANEIIIYAINKRGKLTYAGRQSTQGKTPRNFAIDPTGNFLLAANQNSDEVVIFRRDKKTGMITTPTGKTIAVDKPVCLKFVANC